MGGLNHLKIIQLVEIHRIWVAARRKEVLGSLMDKETLIITIQRLLSSKIWFPLQTPPITIKSRSDQKTVNMVCTLLGQ
jgi:hypothetical protein